MTKNISTRPLSPHLSIYKPQITSMMSIMHRITGFALYIGVILLSWWFIFAVYDYDPNNVLFAFFNSSVGKIFLFLWVYAFFYHLFNGVRHLSWDAGYGFSLSTVKKTGIMVIIFSVLSAVAVWNLISFN